MATRQDVKYEFEGLPLNPVGAGTNLLLTGPALGGTRELLLRLLLGDDGVIVITADTSAGKILSAFEGLGGHIDRDRVRVVSCSRETSEEFEPMFSTVGSPGDLTGIGIEYSGQYEAVYARGYNSARTAIYTLTPLLVYSDDVRPVFRFINTVTSRIRTADGLGICAIDPSAHDEQVVNAIAQPFDARIDVRDRGDRLELRVEGLPDQPSDWTAVSPVK